MRIAALYDIHGNLAALEAVLGEVEDLGVDLVVVGGDVIPGPVVRGTMDRVLGLGVATRFIRGNCETDVLTVLAGEEPTRVPEQHREAIRSAAAQLRPAHRSAIAGWPLTCRVHHDTLGDILFCHATPRSDNEIILRSTDDETLAGVLEGVDAPLVVCGHTHVQFDRQVGSTRIVNAGSVGMPFEGSGAHWLLIGTEVELRHSDL